MFYASSQFSNIFLKFFINGLNYYVNFVDEQNPVGKLYCKDFNFVDSKLLGKMQNLATSLKNFCAHGTYIKNIADKPSSDNSTSQ